MCQYIVCRHYRQVGYTSRTSSRLPTPLLTKKSPKRKPLVTDDKYHNSNTTYVTFPQGSDFLTVLARTFFALVTRFGNAVYEQGAFFTSTRKIAYTLYRAGVFLALLCWSYDIFEFQPVYFHLCVYVPILALSQFVLRFLIYFGYDRASDIFSLRLA